MMQSLYELLKASKGLPVSDSYAALWAKKAESGIKTLTGRLPLTFITSENKLRDWVIHGNNDVGKNLLRLPTGEKTNNGVTFAVNEATGTITTNGTSTGSSTITHSVTLEPGNYIFTCDDNAQRDRTYDSYIRYSGATIARDDDTDAPGNAFTLTETASVTVVNRLWKGNGDTPHVFKPMLRKAGTSEAFEPYQVGVGERTENGYVLNIGVGVAPISSVPVSTVITRKVINLGESPLVEGQTLSMSELGDIKTIPSTDIFIAAFNGFNYDDQLSYNQPEMMIKFKE